MHVVWISSTVNPTSGDPSSESPWLMSKSVVVSMSSLFVSLLVVDLLVVSSWFFLFVMIGVSLDGAGYVSWLLVAFEDSGVVLCDVYDVDGRGVVVLFIIAFFVDVCVSFILVGVKYFDVGGRGGVVGAAYVDVRGVLDAIWAGCFDVDGCDAFDVTVVDLNFFVLYIACASLLFLTVAANVDVVDVLG